LRLNRHPGLFFTAALTLLDAVRTRSLAGSFAAVAIPPMKKRSHIIHARAA
jgi:hypothetical protein